MASNLPEDIITEVILPKLPAKSLLRFKCVSKSFKTLISSPKFIDHHLRHSLSTATNRLLVVNLVGDHGGLHTIDLDSPQLPPLPLRLPDDLQSINENFTLASSNGLLLIMHNDDPENVIVNPITGFYKSFKPAFKFQLGFGYDPIIDDYRLLFLENGSFMIYSLMDESSHSIPADDIVTLSIQTTFSYGKMAVVVNHCLFHWLVWCDMLEKHRIFCLDLSTEKWNLDVPLPHLFETSSSGSASGFSSHFADKSSRRCSYLADDVTNLAVFDGCLSVSTHNVTCHSNIHVWVMKVYGVADSWVKLFRVSEPWSVPLCCSTRPKSSILVYKLGGARLVWYDVSNKRFEDAEIHDAHGVDHLYDPCVFTGSLVMVPGGRRIRQDE